jgi:subtilisin family serine protease
MSSWRFYNTKKKFAFMSDYISEYYEPFGVQRFHDMGIFGKILTGSAAETRLKVYIIDSGFDDNDLVTPGLQVNPDLSAVIVRNFSNEEGSRERPSHGSLTAALIAAPLNNFGILGICPDAIVYLGDVDNADKRLYQTNIVQAVLDAISLEVDVIVMPLGSTTIIPALESAIASAVAAGIYIFASAGNSGLLRYEYPAALPGVISVGSVGLDNQLSSFNTRNERVALFAPGENIFLPSSVGPVLVSGTSWSAPFAAGLAVLHLAKERGENPTYKPTRSELIAILRSEDYLNNGDFSYPSIAPAGDEGIFNSLSGIAVYVGGFLLLAILLYMYITFRDSSRRNKFIKKQKCEVEGIC